MEKRKRKQKKVGIGHTPNVDQNLAYFRAYHHLNEQLFEGKLSVPMLTFNRNTARLGGYYSQEKWYDENDTLISEIGINANLMGHEDIQYLMGVLAHEMLHHWQFEHGSPGRGGYHNPEWIEKAIDLGFLVKGAGDQIETHVSKDGLLDKAIRSMPDEAVFPWLARAIPIPNPVPGHGHGGGEPEKEKGSSGVRHKYTCSVCGLNAWAKPRANLMCGDCERLMVGQV